MASLSRPMRVMIPPQSIDSAGSSGGDGPWIATRCRTRLELISPGSFPASRAAMVLLPHPQALNTTRPE